MNTRSYAICFGLLSAASFTFVAMSVTGPLHQICLGIVGVIMIRTCEATFRGLAMSGRFLSHNKIFKIRGEYKSKNGTYILADFGDGKIETAFLKDCFPSSLKLGGIYTWNGVDIKSAHE